MTETARDRLVGIVIVVVATLWCWAVITTIPAADDATQLGSRGFPLGLGMLFGLLGLAVLATSRGPVAAGALPAQATQPGAQTLAAELWGILVALGLIVGYAIAMEQMGFLLATALVILVAMAVVLQLMRPVLILGLMAGMAGGIYLVFGKLLGVYLPHGQWIDLAL